jgi:formiminotetrahydrofolate cyclodeaminase
MPDLELDVDAMLAALDAQWQKLSAELAGIEDQERRDDISATLASIERQKEDLLQRRSEPGHTE